MSRAWITLDQYIAHGSGDLVRMPVEEISYLTARTECDDNCVIVTKSGQHIGVDGSMRTVEDLIEYARGT